MMPRVTSCEVSNTRACCRLSCRDMQDLVNGSQETVHSADQGGRAQASGVLYGAVHVLSGALRWRRSYPPHTTQEQQGAQYSLGSQGRPSSEPSQGSPFLLPPFPLWWSSRTVSGVFIPPPASQVPARILALPEKERSLWQPSKSGEGLQICIDRTKKYKGERRGR